MRFGVLLALSCPLLCTVPAAAAQQDSEAVVSGVLKAAGGENKLLRLFRLRERLNVSSDPDKKGSERVSVLEPPKHWWLGKRDRVKEDKEPATFLVWAWTLGALTDPDSKMELIPEITESEKPAVGLRVSGTISPPMELYFDKDSNRLVRIDWRADIHRFSVWKEYDGFSYPAKCIGYKKNTGKPWYFSEILELERLKEIPEGLSDEQSAAQQIESFVAAWDDSTWEKSFRTAPLPYMRPLNDDGWKLRMRTMQSVVRAGKLSIPALLDSLTSDNVTQRIFAAQTLGYLAPDVPAQPLLAAAQEDTDAAVRLYAIDALGMKGGPREAELKSLLATEKSGDVRKHINYAIERGGKPIDPSIARQLLDWDSTKMASAAVGQAAPDFELQAATGETIQLSSYRGKSAVVLLFIYGDT